MLKGNETGHDIVEYELPSKAPCDCSFRIGKGTIYVTTYKCHRQILRKGSPIFIRLFFKYNRDKKKTFNIDVDVDPHSFEVMLNYLYGFYNKWPAITCYPIMDVMKLFKTSTKFGVASLRNSCMRILRDQIDRIYDVTHAVLLHFFEFVHSVNMADRYKQQVEVHIFERLSSDTTFKPTAYIFIFEWNQRIFMRYFLLLSEQVSEFERFELLEHYVKYKWTMKNPKRQVHPNIIDIMVSDIRIDQMTLDEFFEGPYSSQLVTYESKSDAIKKDNFKD